MKLRRDFQLFLEYLIHLGLGSAIAAAFLTVSYGFEWLADFVAHQGKAKHVAIVAEIVSWVLLSLDALSLFVFLAVTTSKFVARILKHWRDDSDA